MGPELLLQSPEQTGPLDNQEQLLLFIAEMDAASQTAKADGASDDEVGAIYEAYGDRLHVMVSENYSEGRAWLETAVSYLQMHDCSLEAAQYLERSYVGKYGEKQDDSMHDHFGHDHAGSGHEAMPRNTRKKESKKKKEKDTALSPGWLQLILKHYNKAAKKR